MLGIYCLGLNQLSPTGSKEYLWMVSGQNGLQDHLVCVCAPRDLYWGPQRSWSMSVTVGDILSAPARMSADGCALVREVKAEDRVQWTPQWPCQYLGLATHRATALQHFQVQGTFYCQQDNSLIPHTYSVHTTPLEWVDCHTYLGLCIDHCLPWSGHVAIAARKAVIMLNV